MSVFARQRLILACVLLLSVQAVFADGPSAVTGVKLVYDPGTTHSFTFGGAPKFDSGTKLIYESNETWEWIGNRWIRVYPAQSPSARLLYAMTWETWRGQALLFGGVTGATYLNDTWVLKDREWTKIETANSPSERAEAGLAFDPTRGRSILVGGIKTTIVDNTAQITKYYDTWEFDGTNWVRIIENGPQVETPTLVFDAARNEMLMIGLATSDSKPVMYRFKPESTSWEQMTPAKLPDCVVGANAVYQNHDEKVVLYGATCNTSPTSGETWEWNGTEWTSEITLIARISDEGLAYDIYRQQTIMFGGTLAFGGPHSGTYIYKNKGWTRAENNVSPSPRSLSGFRTNPNASHVLLYSGLSDLGTLDDFWKLSNGKWEKLAMDNGPTFCSSPNSSYDTERNRLVIVCADSSTYEHDGTEWKRYTDLKTYPPQRRFSSMTYDPTIKKTVLFGGYVEETASYIDETWLWDGTTWTRQKNKPAGRRSLAALWYDPVLKKTVMFGGIGQQSREGRVERFNDMWSFDGNGWTKMTVSGTLPAPRYGAQHAVDPLTNTVLLFGGLRLDVNGNVQTQVYANDTWRWDGSKWTQVQTATLPPPRENGAMAWDPTTQKMVLFGGFAGRYLGDRWTFNGTDWELVRETVPTVEPQAPSGPRRRVTTPPPPPTEETP